jgi:uncharacterized membrane protein
MRMAYWLTWPLPFWPLARPELTGREEVESMPTTAWRFIGTEGADEAVLKLKQLEAGKLVEVQDVTVIRWPQYAAEPTVHEHVTEEGSKVSSLMHKITHAGIDSSMVEAATGDMTPGTSVLVLLTPEAAIDAFAKAFEGQGVELIRSDLSVQEQDEVRAALGDSDAADQSQPPGNAPES